MNHAWSRNLQRVQHRAIWRRPYTQARMRILTRPFRGKGEAVIPLYICVQVKRRELHSVGPHSSASSRRDSDPTRSRLDVLRPATTLRQHLRPVVAVVHLAEVGNAPRVLAPVDPARFAPLAGFEREKVPDDLVRKVPGRRDRSESDR